ncbi:TadE/TadG family type IV pilus assembly protein [Paenibacillus alkalitolerans]|uniref:TadE/TadG family type IV pilus assembly protein n=1 Tax=Paenibacillus alkalitolerans TaxID=2799335 RepID=UPI001F1F0380|nr:TadE family protein [Paenibacillus alkalitolerans]
MVNLRQEHGSIALEAAIVLPFFLAFFLTLSFFLSVAQMKTALQDAVDEAVKTTAAHSYPVDLLVHAYRDLPAFQQVESAIDRFLPYEIKVMLGWNKDRKIEGLPLDTVFEGEKTRVLEAWIKPMIASFADRTASGRNRIREDRLVIRSVTIPNFTDERESYFGMTVQYKIPVPIPFIGGEITLTESAYERCWVGNK